MRALRLDGGGCGLRPLRAVALIEDGTSHLAVALEPLLSFALLAHVGILGGDHADVAVEEVIRGRPILRLLALQTQTRVLHLPQTAAISTGGEQRRGGQRPLRANERRAAGRVLRCSNSMPIAKRDGGSSLWYTNGAL